MKGVNQELAEALGLFRAQKALKQPSLQTAFVELIAQSEAVLRKHGRFEEWCQVIDELTPSSGAQLKAELQESAPRSDFSPASTSASLASSTSALNEPKSEFTREQLLQKLGPWKKGPFDVLGTSIDAEWRSDKKWQRVLELCGGFAGEDVLDVGTGNGFFLLRALGAGARFVLGLEPSAHYVAQYLAISRCFPALNMALLPLPGESFVSQCAAFDSVLSMGVLYHRRSPIDHLSDLKGFIKPGGRLILETIVVDGPRGYSLVPEARYAQMRNVWFLPSPLTLESWLKKLKMKEIELSEPLLTTFEEQRSTHWAPGPSLRDFLDPENIALTVEGHPAPKRVIASCRAP